MFHTLRRVVFMTPGFLAFLVPGSLAGQSTPQLNDVVRIRSIAFDDSVFDDLEPIADRIGSARIVVLGEATHSEGSTSRAKARLVRFLHERMGFDVLAWEAGWLDAWSLNAALRGEDPVGRAATHLMRGGWDESVYSRPIFAYARRSWSTDRPLIMAGFDSGRPPYGADHLTALLARASERASELRLPEVQFAAVERLAAWVYSYLGRKAPEVTPADRMLARRALGRLLVGLETPGARLRARFSRRELLVLRLGIQSALEDDALRQLLLTHEPDALERFNRMRDSIMASRLGTVADSLYPDRKIIVWAATAHLIRNSATIRSLDPDVKYGAYRLAGDYLGRAFGDQLYTIGFVAHGGKYGDVFAPGDERGESRTASLPPIHPGSFEAAAHALGIQYLFVDLRERPPADPLHGSFISHALGYIPNRAIWSNLLDALFFIDRAEPEKHHSR